MSLCNDVSVMMANALMSWTVYILYSHLQIPLSSQDFGLQKTKHKSFHFVVKRLLFSSTNLLSLFFNYNLFVLVEMAYMFCWIDCHLLA